MQTIFACAVVVCILFIHVTNIYSFTHVLRPTPFDEARCLPRSGCVAIDLALAEAKGCGVFVPCVPFDLCEFMNQDHTNLCSLIRLTHTPAACVVDARTPGSHQPLREI